MRRHFSLLLFVGLACLGRLQAQTTVAGQIHSGGRLREYRLYVPAAYRPGVLMPVLLNNHALSSSDGYQEYYGDFRPIADTAHFLILHPNGELGAGTSRMWNVFDAPVAGELDDVAFISALLDTICAQYSVDPSRIYSTGFSNGGFLSYELACQLSGRVAAVASVAGTQNVTRLAGCAPVHPTPVLAIHGTADNAVPYNGFRNWASVGSILGYWAAYNNTSSAPIISSLPDVFPADSSVVEHLVWTGGNNGSVVEHYRIVGGGHTWPHAPHRFGPPFGPTNFDVNASVIIWRFFRRFNLNQLSVPVPVKPPPVSLWPNLPGDAGLLYVRAAVPLQPTDARVFDALGREIQIQAVSTNGGLTIDRSSWSRGLYILQLSAGNTVLRRKLLK